MPLESGTYIDSLNASNPLGTGDPKSQGDDHFRLIKSTVKNTFPNLTGAMNATQAELNRLVGVTGVTGTGNLALSASPTFTGTVTADTVAATTLTGAGSGITALNASNLGSGTVPDARFPATLPALNGSALTNLNASNLASGTVADARLSSNVPLKDAANVFTNSQRIANDNATIFFYNTANSTRTGYAQFNASSASAIGTSVSQALGIITADTTRFEIAANGNLDFKSGSVTTANDTADEVGFKGAPIVDISADRTLQLSDAGKVINCAAGADDITVPANTFPAGTIIIISNRTGGSLDIIQGSSQTLQLSGVSGTTGNRTLAYTGLAYLYFIGTNFVNVGGPGVA